MLKKSLLVLSTVSLLSAETTMCFKKNHFDPTTIETIPLQGGKCEGVFSVKDMKEQGYTVSDIKISDGESGLNYIYVFQKEDMLNSAIINGRPMGKEELRSYLKEINREEQMKKLKEEKEGNIKEGKAFYEAHCVECHGQKGELNAYGTSKPLKNMTFEQMSRAINDYEYNDRMGSNAFVMKQYVGIITDDRLKNISAYLKNIK